MGLIIFLSTFVLQHDVYADHDLVHTAIHNCRNVRHVEQVNQSMLYDLLRIEKEIGVPPRLRGMTLAAACHESGFNPKAQGDWTTRHGRRYSRAKGLLQLWPWFANAYGTDRYDPRQSAEAWLLHIKRTVPKAKRFCGASPHKAWLIAWALTARGPGRTAKDKWRCKDIVGHYKVLRRWKRKLN